MKDDGTTLHAQDNQNAIHVPNVIAECEFRVPMHTPSASIFPNRVNTRVAPREVVDVGQTAETASHKQALPWLTRPAVTADRFAVS